MLLALWSDIVVANYFPNVNVASSIISSVQEALTAHKDGKLDHALNLYEQILVANRKEGLLRAQLARIHVNVGGIHYQQNKREEAIAHFEDALLCDPGFSEAHLNLAITLYDDPTQLDRAERHALSALVSRPPHHRSQRYMLNSTALHGRSCAGFGDPANPGQGAHTPQQHL